MIVRIDAFVEDDEGGYQLKEFGAGTLAHLEKNRKKFFIVTARHVVKGADKIEVRFKWKPGIFQAQVAYLSTREDIDLALISVVLPDLPGTIPKVQKAHDSRPQYGDNVEVIGHPLDKNWTKNPSNKVTAPGYTYFSITGTSIKKGNSGGGVFYLGKFLGFVTHVGSVDSRVLHSMEILNYLRQWGINKPNLWLESQIDFEPLIFMAVGGACLALNAAFHNQYQSALQAQQDFENTLHYPFTSAEENDLNAQHDELHADTQAKATLTNAALFGAVAFGGWGLFKGIRNAVRKKKLKR
ncbi:MAG: serine protease [Bacteroidota bacterium]